MTDTTKEKKPISPIWSKLIKAIVFLLLVTLVTTQILILSSLKQIRNTIPSGYWGPSHDVYSVKVVESIPIKGRVEIDTYSSLGGKLTELPIPVTIKSYSGYGAIPVVVK